MSARLHILHAGAHTTVQDLGRPGHRAAGVALGGAVDPVSLRIANLLAGNDEDAAGLECALVGPTIRFPTSCTVALCGAQSAVLPDGRAVRVRAGATLKIGPLTRHAYAYLAIRGGIDVNAVLGSRSTDTRVGFGGHEGRRLERGDVLHIERRASCRDGSTDGVNVQSFLPVDEPIRVLGGADAGRVDGAWIGASFRVSTRSDRMGIRLEGRSIVCEAPAAGPSSIVVPGTIQLPPDGDPIVLLADAQTLGGYLQIAHVISVDLPRIAQRRPGAEVRFEHVDLRTAQRLALKRQRELAMLRYALGARKVRQMQIDLNCDLGEGGDDAALMPLITSANIACGGHAGDERMMRRAVGLALEANVNIGAHPSYEDRVNFGRSEVHVPTHELRHSLVRQIRTLHQIAHSAGATLRHVKPHGALYNVAVRDSGVAGAILDAVVEVDVPLAIVTLPHGALVERAEAIGIEVIPEGFADRAYQSDGTLTPRNDPRAILAREIDSADQVLWMVRDGCVRAIDGSWIPMRVRTICVHGDGARAVTTLRLVRETLRIAGVRLRSF